jgi:hypothetical protein
MKVKKELPGKVRELIEIKKEISQRLLTKANDDVERAKDLLEQVAGKGKRSVKDLDLDTASRVLVALKIDEEVEKEEVKDIVQENKEEIVEKKTEVEEDLLPVPFGTPHGPLAIIPEKAVDKAMAVMEKINNLAIAKLKSMPVSDFVIFGDIVCLRGPGIDKFLTNLFLPVELKNVKELPQEKTPNGYPVFRFQAEAVNIITGMVLPIYSEESSEKKFYCIRKKDGQPYKLPPEQVNLRDVRVAGHRGLRKELVKCFFGLRGMTIEEAEARGIDTKSIYRVPFKGGE